MKERILSGDRPTGKLHLGHYVGSLANRVHLQDQYDTLILIADVQALTTNWEHPEELAVHVLQLMEDYMAIGLDPEKVTFVVQSMVPQIAELTVLFSNLVTVNVLRHNPTVKTEASQHGYDDMTYGFLGYPVSQSADIAFCKANLVPVGEDQAPHMELTRRVIRRFNELYSPVLVEPKSMIGTVGRLVGTDGLAKMSKSLNNCIFLSDDPKTVQAQINKAVTDPARIRATDLGHPEVCTVFAYHKAFGSVEDTAEIEESCRAGSIGCVACKRKLGACLNALLEPMHERRVQYQNHPERLQELMMAGTSRAIQIGSETMREVREAMYINYIK